MASNFTINAELQLDTKGALGAAEKYGKKFSEIVSKAQGFRTNPKLYQELEKNTKLQEKKQKALIDRLQAYEYSAEIKNDVDLARERLAQAAKISALEKSLAQDNLAWEERAKKKVELNVAQVRKQALYESQEQQEDALKSLQAELADVTKEIKNLGMGAEKAVHRIERGLKTSEEWAKKFNNLLGDGAEDFVGKMEDGLSTLSGSLTGSIDLGSMIKGGAGKLAKGMGGIGDMIGSSMGGGGAALSGVVAGLGAVVGAIGIFAALMISTDKEVKELNKSMVNTFGTRALMGMGASTDDLEKNLRSFRHATQDLTENLGLTEQEAVGLFDALDQGGYSFAKLVKGSKDAADSQARLQSTLRDLVSTSKALGVSVNEFSTSSTEFANTYATSLEDIVGQFASIGKMAGDAGFSTRRFYSLVVQAASGQATLNSRASETAEIFKRMAKILGDKQAAEFMGTIGGSFKAAGTGDLIKNAMLIGGKNLRKIAEAELHSQSRVFLGEVKRGQEAVAGTTNAGSEDKIRTAAATAGVTVDLSNEDALTASLARMTNDERDRFVGAVQAVDSNLGRRLDQLSQVSKGGTEAMRAFSTGGIVRSYEAMAKNFGVDLAHMTDIQRMAFANISGLSEEQITEISRLARGSQGAWGVLQQQLQTQTLSTAQLEAQYGVQIRNGEIQDSAGNRIVDATEYLVHAQETGHDQDMTAMSEDQALAWQAFDQTVTIADILENKILYFVRALYEDVGTPIINFLGRSNSRARDAAKMRLDLNKQIAEQMTKVSDAGRTEARLGEKKRAGTLTPEEQAQLDAATRARGEASTLIEEARKRVSKLSRGDMSPLDEQTPAQKRVSDAVQAQSEQNRAQSEAARRERLSHTTVAGVAGVAADRASRQSTGHEDSLTQGIRRGSHSVNAAEWATPAQRDVARQNQEDMASFGISPSTPTPVAPTHPTAAPPAAHPTPVVPTPVVTTPGVHTTPVTTPHAPAPATPPAVTTTPSPVADRVSNEHTEAVVGAMEATGTATVDATTAAAVSTADALHTEHEESRKRLVKILTKDVKLGNALARSDLPQAIVDAQVAQQLEALAYASGMTDPDQVGAAISQYFADGTFTTEFQAAMSDDDPTDLALAAQRRALGISDKTGIAEGVKGRHRGRGEGGGGGGGIPGALNEADDPMEDFVYRGDGVRGTLTPIDEKDTFVGMKPGGAIDNAINGGGGRGGNVTVNIYGGDERRVFEVVKRVLQQSGIGPTRVGARA